MSACSETKFRAKDIPCPVCHVDADQNCTDSEGRYRAPHVERARVNRWTKMGVKGLD